MRNIDSDNELLTSYGLPVIDDDTAQAGFSLCGHYWPTKRDNDITQIRRCAPVVEQDNGRRARIESLRLRVENNLPLFE